ncbi:MAG: pyridoxal phosphate-dependent aminotransferase [Sphaerochaetaceae bacterium]|nr:pyridoxal phosphate-dependent aminotransferase [Sphaerochaetaceae bacterium]
MNKLLDGISASATVAFNNMAKKMKQEGKSIVSLAGGDPDFETPKRIRDALSSAVSSGKTHYCDSRGITPLRERIALKLKTENGISCTADNILVTPGAKYAIYLAVMSICSAGDEVLLPQPSWVSYEAMARLAGAVPVGFPLSASDNFILTEALLESYITERTRLLIINSPNNPTGRVLTASEWEAVRSVVKKHDLYLISDEVYEKIIFDGRKNISPASFEDIKTKTITINSFSKSYAMTGWRIGYMCAPKFVTELCYLQLSHEISCTNEFVQYAALEAFNCEEESAAMCAEYERRRDYLVQEISSLPGFKVIKPEGAFYLWVHIEHENMDSSALAMWLLEKAGVVTVPGDAFGKGGEKCLRLCFAYSFSDLEEAVRRIKKCL